MMQLIELDTIEDDEKAMEQIKEQFKDVRIL